MRLGGAGIIAAVLALAGCKTTDPKAPDKKELQASTVERNKGQTPAWLEDSMAKLPGAGTTIPKAGSWSNPKDPNFNPVAESRGLLAGKVFDPTGRGAKGVFIRIESVDATPRDSGAAIGILTDSDGFFMAKDLPQGKTYNLTAEARLEGKQLYGVIQTRPPNSNISINLRDDLAPPLPAPLGVSPGDPSSSVPPLRSGLIPPTGSAPQPQPGSVRPSEGAWGPASGAGTTSIPATIGPSLPPPSMPTPTLTQPPGDQRPTLPRPENIADVPGFRPPAANIPGPPGVPQYPTLPPSLPALPPTNPNQTEKRSYRAPAAPQNFALVDALGRPWEFAENRTGSLVLLEFMTTTCIPCKRAIPTLIDLQGRYAAEGLQVVGVVCDDAPEIARASLADKYQQEHKLNYLLYVEPGAEPGSVRDRFHVEEYPTAILLDAAGNIIWRGHPANKTALENIIVKQLRK